MNDLLLRTLRCEPTPRRPLWIMRQAGRYLPEYRALKEQYTFLQLAGDPDLAARVTMLPFEHFALDAAIVFADLLSPAASLGLEVDFKPGPVLAKPLRTAEAIRRLPLPSGEEVAPEVPATLRLVKEQLAGRANLIGFAGAPLSLAAYLVEGQGSKAAYPRLRGLLLEDPVLFGDLLAHLAETNTRFLLAQHAAGADCVQVFESWAGLLPRSLWRVHVRPHLEAMLTELGRAGVPRILFAHDAGHLIEELATLPADALAVDWRVDLAELRTELGPERAVQGNLDPAALLAGPETTVRAARALLESVPARGHVVNLGHGILPEVPLESVHALVETVRAEESPTG